MTMTPTQREAALRLIAPVPTIGAGQWIREADALLRELAAGPDLWRDTVDHMLSVCHAVASDDPRESIDRLIDWHVQVALDPEISSDAAALVERGRALSAHAAAQSEPQADDALRWRWLIRHASLGFDGATSWNAVIRLPVFDSTAQTITVLVDAARAATGDFWVMETNTKRNEHPPPQRQPLSAEQIDAITRELGFGALTPSLVVRAVERAHGIGEAP